MAESEPVGGSISYRRPSMFKPFILRLMIWQTICVVLGSLWVLEDLDSIVAPMVVLIAPSLISAIVWRLSGNTKVDATVQQRRRALARLIVVTVIWTAVHAYVVFIARPAMVYARNLNVPAPAVNSGT